MDTLLQIANAFKSYGTKDLFNGASMAVNEGEHVGVIGPNGAGKTTLFKVLAGEEDFDSGEVIKSHQLRLGYLRQHDDWTPEETVEDFCLRNSLLSPWEIKSIGRGLGVDLALFERKMASLSGGYKMRVKLLALLGEQPNLLLLDEPTNYLDLETLLFLEDFLASYKGAYLLISHDREFLRKTCDNILEIEGGEMTKFPGALDDYFEEKEMLRAQLESRALSLEAKRKEIIDFVTRFGAKASKARQAQSRLKSLARMETIDLKPLPERARIQMPPIPQLPRINFEFKEVSTGYGEKEILKEVSLQIERGDHLGVVGFNGVGKSTFLKTLAGMLPTQKGIFKVTDGVKLSLFNQHVSEGLEENFTIYETLMRAANSKTTIQEIKALAGSLLFSGGDIEKPIRVLSGGERSRVALGKVLLSGANVLLLDEPTNHLDFDTVEALGNALRQFAGTLIVVSHDRGFLKKVSKKIIEIREGHVSLYPGTYDEYVWSLQKGILSLGNTPRESKAEKSGAALSKAEPKKNPQYHELKNLESDLKKAEKAVERLTNEITELESGILVRGYNKDDALKLNELKEKLTNQEENFLALLEKKESLK